MTKPKYPRRRATHADVESARKDAMRGWRMFETALKLGQYAEREKRLASGTERAYWQGTCDACRKLTNVFRGEGMFMELFEDALNPTEPAR